MIPKQITTKKTLEFFVKDINKQVLETKYTLNLGQLLQVIHDIKHYIFNPIPSKHALLEQAITLVTIDHQMTVI
jgi:hypothetical protein